MDLRKEINDIIEETGHYVLLQRTSRKLRCLCWDEKYQESAFQLYVERTGDKRKLDGCPKCLGKGWVSRIERHKVRRQTASNIISLPGKIKQTTIGELVTDTRTFFMKYNVVPRKGDILMEVGWKGTTPTHLIQAFEISHADDLREKNGRVEFYQVSTKEISVDTKIRGFTIRKIGPIKNYEILR